MTAPLLGEGLPPVTCTPETPGELADALRDAQLAGERVLLAGKGLRLEQGNLVEAERLILTTRLNRLVDYQPDDMTVTAEAGMTLWELQALLESHGQRLALDPAYPKRTTLGGLVAANPDGPWRSAFGTVRDQLLGLSLATADGVTFKSGSRVVKSVAGYDLPKLFTGSYGTLGAILQVSLRTRPLPTASAGILARFEEISALEAAWLSLRRAPLEPAYFELGLDSKGAFLAMGFEGEPEAVRWQQEAFEARVHAPCELQSDDFRPALAERAHAEGTALLIKAGLPPSSALPFLADARREGGTWTGHAGQGILYGAFPEAERWDVGEGRARIEALRDRARARDGYLVVLRAPRAWKQGWDVWGPTRPDFPLMKALKRAFDPAGTLAPGRFVGGL